MLVSDFGVLHVQLPVEDAEFQVLGFKGMGSHSSKKSSYCSH